MGSRDQDLLRYIQSEARFQFIEFPSEWGGVMPVKVVTRRFVSNLLSSPASGEDTLDEVAGPHDVFPIY